MVLTEITLIFRDHTEYIIDSENNIRIVLMVIEFPELTLYNGNST